jgi:hypothetical protein
MIHNRNSLSPMLPTTSLTDADIECYGTAHSAILGLLKVEPYTGHEVKANDDLTNQGLENSLLCLTSASLSG